MLPFAARSVGACVGIILTASDNILISLNNVGPAGTPFRYKTGHLPRRRGRGNSPDASAAFEPRTMKAASSTSMGGAGLLGRSSRQSAGRMGFLCGSTTFRLMSDGGTVADQS